ncbi:MAG: WD40 repeat domain-containing protein [Deltaproteobacteria bacterium]|nr:MAG: WD40 repeat domain-containing protein [Deltaproteobacteria bacterium]
MFRNLQHFCFVAVLVLMPLLANCICIPPRFNGECQTSSDCYDKYGVSRRFCVAGLCETGTYDTSCTTGTTRRCRLSGAASASYNCAYGKQTCLGGRWSTCLEDRSKYTKEVCNGIDDDCDGSVDETYPEMNQACTVPGEKGPCAKGEYRSCTLGKLVCLSTTLPRPEGEVYRNCTNGQDDDCDGYIDDPVHDDCPKCKDGDKRECYPFRQGLTDPTVDVGPCKKGTQVCNGEKWGACEGAVVPTQEVCGNSIDEDCDGTPDNTCNQACKPGETRPCYGGPASTNGVGACKGGIQTCNPDTTWSLCVGEVLPKGEVCGNQLDDDCNGKVDDCNPATCAKGETRACYVGAAGTRGVGACKDGVQTCTDNGDWKAPCVGMVVPKTETCGNQTDDDCNGKVDDCQVSYLLSSSWDKQAPLYLWDINTNKVIRSYVQGHTDAVYASRFAPDGKSLVSVGHDKQVIAWSTDLARVLWKATGHTAPIYGVVMDPQGKWVLTGGEDKSLRFWDMATGKGLATVNGHNAAIYSLAIDSKGSWVATGTGAGVVRLWERKGTNLLLKTSFTKHTLGVFAVAFGPKGRWLASGSRDGSVYLLDLLSGTGSILNVATQGITSLAFDSSGQSLAVGSAEGTVFLYDVSGPTPKATKTLQGTAFGAVYSLAFHPARDVLVAGHYNNSIRVWDLKAGTVSATLKQHNGPVSSLSYRP